MDKILEKLIVDKVNENQEEDVQVYTIETISKSLIEFWSIYFFNKLTKYDNTKE